MDRVIEEFVHQQNLRRFRMLLAQAENKSRQHLLSQLLVEEEAKWDATLGQDCQTPA
jgi:hypothetical protein